jgi:hypothetical protein
MAGIAFEPPFSGHLEMSGEEILVFGVFESGKAAFCRKNGVLMVSDDPILLEVVWDDAIPPIDTESPEDG